MLSALYLNTKLTKQHLLSLFLCLAGLIMATYPLLQTSYASINGLVLIHVSMLAYSAGAIYFARTNWNNLDVITINGWQTLIGGIILLPALLLTYMDTRNSWDSNFWMGTLWLAIPVSIVAVQAWLLLLKKGATKASYWLFLCPLVGFTLSAWLFNEPLSWFTAIGVALVLIGLYSRNVKRELPVVNIND
ncbi:MAG: EamA family transporter [Chitinophagaceae bacterium]|nr:MAG: EamA family transporter [Chitinophagaceae bacterium]